jgi:hypothetical protein
MGSLARALETFFTSHGLAMATDRTERLAAGRRQRRVVAVPESLRPSAEACADFMMRSRDRSRRSGTMPCGFPPRVIRCTRLLDLVNTMDPELVAAAFGMDPEATMIYLADHGDPGRLPDQQSQ